VRFIHTADLHLSVVAKDYAMSVLAEIGTAAVREHAAAIVFAGDTFDSFPDAYQLRGDFARWAEGLPAGMEVAVLPGNHEELDRGTNTLAALSFGSRVRLATATPFELMTIADTELILFPFRSGYLDPSALQIPPRVAPSRIAVMHGTVAGSAHTGDGSEEAENSFIDPSMFSRLDVSYVAMGHLHGARDRRVDGTLIAYPGSARVWRKGERGPRIVCLVETSGKNATLRKITLSSAGEYREYHCPVSLDGRAADLGRIAEGWSPADMVTIILTGIVDDENAADVLRDEIAQAYAGRARSLEVIVDVEPVAGIAAHPAAERFLTLLAAQASGTDPDVLERARKLGLAAVAKKMGGAS
jgi:hypothetical protein